MAAKPPPSRKRSGTSSPPPPEPLTFFLDKCLGKNVVANALLEAGHRVERLTDHFKQDATDEEWLTWLKGKSWIVLTKDSRIQYNQVEVEALLRAGVMAFVLRGSDINGADMAKAFVNAISEIRNIVKKHAPPLVATVSPSGKVSKLCTNAQILKRIHDRRK